MVCDIERIPFLALINATILVFMALSVYYKLFCKNFYQVWLIQHISKFY